MSASGAFPTHRASRYITRNSPPLWVGIFLDVADSHWDTNKLVTRILPKKKTTEGHFVLGRAMIGKKILRQCQSYARIYGVNTVTSDKLVVVLGNGIDLPMSIGDLEE